MRYAIIESGVVVNAVLAEPEYAASQGWVPLPDGAGGGWLYANGAFVAPPPAPPLVPAVVSMRQARLALLAAGHLSKVNAALAALPSPQKEAAQIEWEYATEVRRESDLVKNIGAAIGLDAAALDALFIAGAKL